MVKKTISKRPNQRKKRETIKLGGMKSFTRTQTRIINELAEFASLNQDIAANIITKVKALQNLYTDESHKSLEEEDNAPISSLSESIGSVEERNRTQYEPLDWLPDIEQTTTNYVSDKKPVLLNNERTNNAKPGTWEFYILKFLDEEPKTENEITDLIIKQYPHKFKGKTSDNTINNRLQKLVREGKAQRNQYTKGKRSVYRYLV
jgi:hypothetical protein